MRVSWESRLLEEMNGSERGKPALGQVLQSETSPQRVGQGLWVHGQDLADCCGSGVGCESVKPSVSSQSEAQGQNLGKWAVGVTFLRGKLP